MFSKFEWAINLLILFRILSNYKFTEKNLKIAIRNTAWFESFYCSNDPELVLAIGSIRVWISFSIVIHEKNRVLNAAGVWASCDSPSAAGPGQSHAGGPGKFDFDCSKNHTLAYYLFIFHVEFSAVWGSFV